MICSGNLDMTIPTKIDDRRGLFSPVRIRISNESRKLSETESSVLNRSKSLHSSLRLQLLTSIIITETNVCQITGQKSCVLGALRSSIAILQSVDLIVSVILTPMFLPCPGGDGVPNASLLSSA